MSRVLDAVDRPIDPSGGADRPGLRIAFFAHDDHDSAIVKRMHSLRNGGAEVMALMFTRRGDARKAHGRGPVDVDLGPRQDGQLLRRIPRLFRALARLPAQRTRLAACHLFLARNLDMLILAVIARRISRSTAPIVYEVLDIHRTMLGPSRTARLMRAIERRLLARVAMLVVSSPDYITHYFTPVQAYRGPWRLMENKLGPGAPARAGHERALPSGPPWRIGWFGVLKCQRSLGILRQISATLGPAVHIHIAGIIAHSVLPPSLIANACRAQPNITYTGAYSHPHDLPRLYGGVHFVWAADFLDAQANSAWCLPNRVYEGGAYGALALCARGNATARMIERHGIGLSFAEPLEETVPLALAALGSQDFMALRRRLLEADPGIFRDLGDTDALLDAFAQLARIPMAAKP
jgi:succinoglycan biosynthesis protein ExoL